MLDQPKTKIVRISAYGVIVRDGDILLCRLSAELPRYAGMWTLPGGGLDFGEHPETGMIREVYEETGLNVHTSSLVGVHSFTRELEQESFQGIQMIYDSAVHDNELRFETSGTTDMCQWHPINDLGTVNRVELVDVALSMIESPR